MAFTEQDLKNQKEEIARLADELSRLNSVFAEQKKALGIPETETVTVAESIPPLIPMTTPLQPMSSTAFLMNPTRRSLSSRVMSGILTPVIA